MLPVDSLKLHGKLYFVEYDTRTFRTRLLRESHPEICRENTYDSPVWKGPSTEAASLGILRMNFAQQLTGGHASWWFDMWGGWFDSPGIMREMKLFRTIAESALKEPRRESVAECAAWIDETCFAQTDSPVSACCSGGRIAIVQSGIPFDFYLMSDFDRTVERYRAALFFLPVPTPEAERAIAVCRTKGIPVLILSPEVPVTAEKIRDFCVRSGIHCYNPDGDAVFVSRSYLAVHAAYRGEHPVILPNVRRILPRIPAGEAVVSDRITLFLESGDTALFQLQDEEDNPTSSTQTRSKSE